MRIASSEAYPAAVPCFTKYDIVGEQLAMPHHMPAEADVLPPIENTPLPEESEELYRYTKFGITTIVYSCGYMRFVLEIDENPELRNDKNHYMPFTHSGGKTEITARHSAELTAHAYAGNLWSNMGGLYASD